MIFLLTDYFPFFLIKSIIPPAKAKVNFFFIFFRFPGIAGVRKKFPKKIAETLDPPTVLLCSVYKHSCIHSRHRIYYHHPGFMRQGDLRLFCPADRSGNKVPQFTRHDAKSELESDEPTGLNRTAYTSKIQGPPLRKAKVLVLFPSDRGERYFPPFRSQKICTVLISRTISY